MRRLALFALVLGIFSGLASAQDSSYRLQPEDVIVIQIYNEPQVAAQVPVDRNGNISAPFVGIVKAAGKTTAELETELKALYIENLKLRDPKVSVTILKFREWRATIGGMVGRPGTVPVRPGDTLMTLLNYGGGPQFDRADLKRAMLRRANSREQIPVDLQALLNGDTSQNYVLEDGDELIVPEDLKNRLFVLGAIQSPGVYGYKDGMTLTDAISMARGEVPRVSKLSEVMVIREMPGAPGNYLRIKSNYVNFIRKGDYTQNIPLKPGDMIYVPSTRTPDITQISAFVNTAFFLDSVLRRGIFFRR